MSKKFTLEIISKGALGETIRIESKDGDKVKVYEGDTGHIEFTRLWEIILSNAKRDRSFSGSFLFSEFLRMIDQ